MFYTAFPNTDPCYYLNTDPCYYFMKKYLLRVRLKGENIYGSCFFQGEEIQRLDKGKDLF